MGGDLDKFGSSSMFDYQILKASYDLINGIDEDVGIQTTEDLDRLYASIDVSKL